MPSHRRSALCPSSWMWGLATTTALAGKLGWVLEEAGALKQAQLESERKNPGSLLAAFSLDHPQPVSSFQAGGKLIKGRAGIRSEGQVLEEAPAVSMSRLSALRPRPALDEVDCVMSEKAEPPL